jgi:hypothetical protein
MIELICHTHGGRWRNRVGTTTIATKATGVNHHACSVCGAGDTWIFHRMFWDKTQGLIISSNVLNCHAFKPPRLLVIRNKYIKSQTII